MANPFIPSIGIGSTLVGFIVLFIIYLLIVGFVLWLAGEIVVGRKVTFGEALAVAGTGTFLVGAVISFVQGLFGLLIGLLIFLPCQALLQDRVVWSDRSRRNGNSRDCSTNI